MGADKYIINLAEIPGIQLQKIQLLSFCHISRAGNCMILVSTSLLKKNLIQAATIL
jgi:hypothetical protein